MSIRGYEIFKWKSVAVAAATIPIVLSTCIKYWTACAARKALPYFELRQRRLRDCQGNDKQQESTHEKCISTPNGELWWRTSTLRPQCLVVPPSMPSSLISGDTRRPEGSKEKMAQVVFEIFRIHIIISLCMRSYRYFPPAAPLEWCLTVEAAWRMRTDPQWPRFKQSYIKIRHNGKQSLTSLRE